MVELDEEALKIGDSSAALAILLLNAPPARGPRKSELLISYRSTSTQPSSRTIVACASISGTYCRLFPDEAACRGSMMLSVAGLVALQNLPIAF